jgi:hypothetical protein
MIGGFGSACMLHPKEEAVIAPSALTCILKHDSTLEANPKL